MVFSDSWCTYSLPKLSVANVLSQDDSKSVPHTWSSNAESSVTKVGVRPWYDTSCLMPIGVGDYRCLLSDTSILQLIYQSALSIVTPTSGADNSSECHT